MTAVSRLGYEGYGVKRAGNFASKTPGSAGGPHPVGVITRLALDGYGARRLGSFAGKTASAVVVPVELPDSFARGGGATKKQLKKYQQNEERFQRQRRELERQVFETMGKPKASLKNTAELGGPKVIEIDDDDDDYDIMMWAAQ